MEEANGAESKRDFTHKVGIAYKEARETRLWLGMIRAAILADGPDLVQLYAECDELVRILFTIRKNARASQRTTQR